MTTSYTLPDDLQPDLPAQGYFVNPQDFREHSSSVSFIDQFRPKLDEVAGEPSDSLFSRQSRLSDDEHKRFSRLTQKRIAEETKPKNAPAIMTNEDFAEFNKLTAKLAAEQQEYSQYLHSTALAQPQYHKLPPFVHTLFSRHVQQGKARAETLPPRFQPLKPLSLPGPPVEDKFRHQQILLQRGVCDLFRAPPFPLSLESLSSPQPTLPLPNPSLPDLQHDPILPTLQQRVDARLSSSNFVKLFCTEPSCADCCIPFQVRLFLFCSTEPNPTNPDQPNPD